MKLDIYFSASKWSKMKPIPRWVFLCIAINMLCKNLCMIGLVFFKSITVELLGFAGAQFPWIPWILNHTNIYIFFMMFHCRETIITNLHPQQESKFLAILAIRIQMHQTVDHVLRMEHSRDRALCWFIWLQTQFSVVWNATPCLS